MSGVHDDTTAIGLSGRHNGNTDERRVRELRPGSNVQSAEIVRESSPLDDTVSISAPVAGIVVIDHRTLIRECLVRALRTVITSRIISFATVAAWLEVADKVLPSVILLGVSGTPSGSDALHQASSAVRENSHVPIIVIGDSEDPDLIIHALENGVRGYIPTNLPLSIAVQALRLVTEGGIFVPASSLIAAHHQPVGKSQSTVAELEMFTARQAAVVRALCRGKANKVIAYELNMCESTVKVHVRNIMKKLKAKNRTEVAVMFKSLGNSEITKLSGHSQF